MKIKQIYSRNTDQEGWEDGQLVKTEVRTRMWFTCDIYEGQGHDSKPHVPRAVQKPYVTQETSVEYLLNKINMYLMLIPLNS